MKILVVLLLFLMANQVSANETHELKIVKQVYDINAESADKMYQFIPDYLAINVGDSVQFLGTVGRHTVHSVRDMIPEGVKKIAIMPRQPNRVKFDKAGIYGINCKLHQRHGMISLIVVGGDLHNMEKARQGVQWISPHSRDKMNKLLDRAKMDFSVN
jgi:pseudoazurin